MGSGPSPSSPSLALMVLAGPARATGPADPDATAAARELEQQEQASRLELQSVADQAAHATQALSALESDIAALRADQRLLDQRIAETASRRASLDQ
ncbi:MAG: hypothetical protein U1A06_16560, partial [Hoeflea sp.]|nr:hypothetical protein [Hoeflea sp.]